MRVFALTVSFLRGFVASKKNAFRRRFLPPEICLFCDVIQGIQKEVRITPDMCYQALFDGLIPEGWLLEIAEKSWKINRRDRMSLLLACCKDCIGSVCVVPIINEESL